MARNRKRAKERRARRPQPVASGRVEPVAGDCPEPVVGDRPAPVGSDRAGRTPAPDPIAQGAPDPIGQAAPDSELAEARLALGRPEVEQEEPALADGDGEDGNRTAEGVDGTEGDGEPPEAPGGELAFPEAPRPPGPLRAGNRLATFIQGSWRELQRVQWPDRRQVMQATGVVIGFVIVAGAFLGVADTIAGKLVTLILK